MKQPFLENTRVKDIGKLDEYLDFCKNNSEEYGELHHILPVALFLEYKKNRNN